MRSRRKWVVVVLVLATAANIALWFEARTIRSPSQVAALAKPPPFSLITAPVQLRTLTAQFVFRADIGASNPVDLIPPQPGQGTSDIITAVVAGEGSVVREGDVIVMISGRPVFVLGGALPAYRDLTPGDDGPDVLQLQRALTRLGDPVSDLPGTFGVGTQAALRRLYGTVEVDPALTSPDAPQLLQTAKDGVTAALQQQVTAKQQLTAAETTGMPQTTLMSLEQALSAAGTAVKSAEANDAEVVRTTGVMLPQAEVLYLQNLPGVVVSSTAVVGQRTGSGVLMTLSDGGLVGSAYVTQDQSTQLRPGMQVDTQVDGTQAVLPSTITSVAVTPTAAPDGSSGYLVQLNGQTPFPPNLVGVNVKVTATTGSSGGAVLTVPYSALSSDATGAARVAKVLPGGKTILVPVQIGFTAGGYAQVIPGSVPLKVGDLVSVGPG